MYQVLQRQEIEGLKNETSYPISLDEVKQWCNISLSNNQKDFLIQNKIIPSVIENWENETKFYLLDCERKGILDNQYCYFSKLRMEALNIRNITSIEYFPANYTTGPMSFLDIDNDVEYEDEIDVKSLKIHYKNGILNLFYKFTNRLIVSYAAGYLDNDFSLMPAEIKRALLEMAYNDFQKEIGSCKQSNNFIDKAISKYGIKNDYQSVHATSVINVFRSGML